MHGSSLFAIARRLNAKYQKNMMFIIFYTDDYKKCIVEEHININMQTMISNNFCCLLLILVLRYRLLFSQSCGSSVGYAIPKVITLLIPCQVKSGFINLTLPHEWRPDSLSILFLLLPNRLSVRCGESMKFTGSPINYVHITLFYTFPPLTCACEYFFFSLFLCV